VTPGGNDRVDVVTFEWTHRLEQGGSGLGVVRSSLPEHERARWSGDLVTRVSVPPGDREPSTCYLRLRGRAVLLHRTPAPDQLHRGSTRTVALIGPPSTLTLGRAIALRPATELIEGDGPYGSYPSEWADASDGDEVLGQLAKDHREQAITLVAGLLDGSPAEGFAIRAGGADPRALLWVASRCMHSDGWTFSTRESLTTAAGLPMLVFAAGQPPRSSFGSRRCWLDLSRPPPARPSTVQEAVRRVDLVLTGRSRAAVTRPHPRRNHDREPGVRQAEPDRGNAATQPRPGLPGPYVLRLSLLVVWSALFIVLLALAGQLPP
jgi:hypothetical protein